VQASGTLRGIDLSHGDSPWLHTSHDLELDVAVDPASAWLVLGGGSSALLHVEAESSPFPVDYRPVPGERVTVAGRWVYDCGHDPKTEIHPAAVVASEHDEWRADFAGGAGAPRPVRVVRVWMNSAPGLVHVPLAPFDLHTGFPPAPAGAAASPMVQVAAGDPRAVQWTITPGAQAGAAPAAAVQLAPPATAGAAGFVLLLGYRAPAAAPAPNPPLAYTVAFDQLVVHDDLRRASRNTTGIPAGLLYPQLGFPGSGAWVLQATVGPTWRALLDYVPVQGGHTYSLAAVPPVSIVAPGAEHLPLAITGYAENDPSDGVQRASGSITGASVLSWDAGALAGLCCDQAQRFTAPHGVWTLAYHVSRATP
jgi:hypothetical protein